MNARPELLNPRHQPLLTNLTATREVTMNHNPTKSGQLEQYSPKTENQESSKDKD
jgi:hypothetical protein